MITKCLQVAIYFHYLEMRLYPTVLMDKFLNLVKLGSPGMKEEIFYSFKKRINQVYEEIKKEERI